MKLASIVAVTLSLTSLASAGQYTVSGPGGAIPAVGSGGGGTWPTAFPPSPAVSQVVLPANAVNIRSIAVLGLQHTWIGDLQFVLVDPLGHATNLLHRPGFTGGNTLGSPGDAVGDDVFILDVGGRLVPESGDLQGGDYLRYEGSPQNGGAGKWPSNALATNEAMRFVHIIPGQAYQLRIYDWWGADVGSFSGWEVSGDTGYFVLGAGGAIPSAGTGGGGTWPTTLPPSPFSSAVSIPGDAASIDALVLSNLQHTFAGDLQVVLWQAAAIFPIGYGNNLLHRPGFTGSGFGNSGDFLGGGLISIASSSGRSIPESGNIGFGRYDPYFGSDQNGGAGTWPSGANSISNRDLRAPQVPVYENPKTYTLRVYDWASGDVGSLGTWGLLGHRADAPFTYCYPGRSALGCAPALRASARPSRTYANPCTITAIGVEGQRTALFFYSLTERKSSPWGGANPTSYLCISAPTQRTGVQNTGGTAGVCNGTASLDWNAWHLGHPGALGQPWTGLFPPNAVRVQLWYRDPASPGLTNLSEALEMYLVP